MHFTAKLQNKYDHALDRIFDLYKAGREREIIIEKALDLARDELERILACPTADAEIRQLCKRGLDDTNV